MLRASILALCAMSAPLAAADLRIAIGSVVTSTDPHFYNASPNNTVASQVFEPLVARDPDGKLIPVLARSWETPDETTWIFHLRENVTFHDGSPLTADDVVFTFDRARNVPNSPGSFAGYLSKVASTRAIDDLTLEVKTTVPSPFLLSDIAPVVIISREAGTDATTEDYNQGKATIGTGPFKFVSFQADTRVQLARNDAYWGNVSEWDNVTYQMIPAPATRVAGLLAGDLDVIDAPNAADVPKLRENPDVVLSEREGLRSIFVIVSHREQNDFVRKLDGSAFEKNPLTDVRVRKALSISIDRELIASRLMQGTVIANGHFLPKGTETRSDKFDDLTAQADTAKALLAEAGLADGFQISLHVPSDRYPNAPAVAQAIAQMWARIGVKTTVETQPWSSFAKDQDKYALTVFGYGNVSNDARSALQAILGDKSRDKAFGSQNFGAYSNAEMDALTISALSSFDIEARTADLTKAADMALEDAAIIPLYNQINTWVTRKGLTITPRQAERTFASDVKSN